MRSQLSLPRLSYSFLALSLLLAATPIHAATIFSDDFESGTLSAWSVNYSGQVTADPLNSGNKALHFFSTTSGGDLWSGYLPYTLGSTLNLSFDYLVETQEINPFAFLGTDHTIGSYGDEQWLLSSVPGHGGAAYSGLEDLSFGVWHHIALTFQPYDPNFAGTIVLKLEQNGGVAGNAYFDNIVLSDSTGAPEPATWSLLAGVLLAVFTKLPRFLRKA